MADQQGTGKHPHKSAAEPHEHHEAPTTKGGSRSGGGEHASSGSHSSASSSGSHSGEQGTGKHPHKSSHDPKEHHEGAKSSK